VLAADGPDAPPGLITRIDAALGAASRFLVRQQSLDGAWRGKAYGSLRNGPALTPYVMSCLFFLPQGGSDARGAFRKGVAFLISMVGDDGEIREPFFGLNYPVYTAASASRVVVLAKKDEVHRKAQRAWLNYLLRRRLSRERGWKPSDPEFGGWGYSLRIPRKPPEGGWRERFVESNLSATLFGIAALRSARIPASDPLYAEILVFVKRCQNFPEGPEDGDPKFDDGGFFFIPGDPLQNKAGVAGRDRSGRRRFHSYGTMTADGVRALLRCGMPKDHPRVVAARTWLERRFSAAIHPGNFAKEREVLRGATYYYWCWAAAHAFQALGIKEVRSAAGKVRWAEVLAEELLRRQRKDGTWVNRYTDAKEDDPLVAVPWAASALALCRVVITGDFLTLVPRPSASLPVSGHPGRSER
jgi:squalene-hopene/tetraprenyl-beta-curcumene cyclase